MKKGIVSLVVIISVLLSGCLNLNRINTDEYYTQIQGEGNEIEDTSKDGTVYVKYEYELPAYDQDGNEKKLTFTANKQLRENAYLLLYVKNTQDVTSYQEVKHEEIPEKAVEMFQ